MHQLARSARRGLGQPAQFCMASFSPASLTPAGRHMSQGFCRRQARRYASEPTDATADKNTDGTEADPSAKPPTTPSAEGTKAKTPGTPPAAGPMRKNAGRKTKKSAGRSQAGNSATQASQTQLKLWRETLDVLTKLEKAQGRLAEQAAIATGEAAEAAGSSNNASVETQGTDSIDSPDNTAKPAKSKKKKAPVYTEEQKIAALESAKEAQEQVKKLTSALHLLKTVLSTQGSQNQVPETASRDEQADNKPGKNAKKKARKKAEAEADAPSAAPTKTTPPPKKKASVPVSAASAAAAAGKGLAKVLPLAPDGKVGKPGYRVSNIESSGLTLNPIEENMRPVPRLHYGLDRALFNLGVYHLQDPRSRVFNFDPYLATIMPLQEFDFNALKQYVTSSKDSTLISMARKHNMKYSGSTSSMTSMLSHFHYLLSGWRPINAEHTSRSFTPESFNFTRIMRSPAATFLHYKDGTYAIDADKEFDSANVLSMLGKSMEKLLTLSKEDFEKYRVTRSHELTEEERSDPESFHYTTFGDFMMRSQLDAHDPRLPGTGMFDLKTRAVVSIRMDARDFKRGLGYEIRSRFGQWESFEREYFDMIRSAFLKYSLQVRMGRMDGIYVAFHNTERIFGFQYISINEMDLALHGTENKTLGDREFMLSLRLLNEVMDKATQRFPGRSLRLHVETRPSEAAPFMYVFAKPVTAEEIAEVQDANKESVEEFERNILGLNANRDGENGDNSETEELADAAADNGDADLEAREYGENDNENDIENDNAEPDYEEETDDVWETMRQRVEETMENEAQGIETVRDAIEDALEQSGLLRGRSPEETRAYVDALLGAITRMDTEAVAERILKGQEEATEEDPEAEAEANASAGESAATAAAEGAPESTATTVAAESTPALPDGAETILSSASAASLAEDDPSKSIIDEDGHNYVVDSESLDKGKAAESAEQALSSSSSSPPGTLSLKDLIIKLAAQVEAAQARSDTGSTAAVTTGTIEGSTDKQIVEADNAADDEPKNKRFERILSALMASSKESKSTAKATTASSPASASNGSTEPEADELMGMIVTIRNKVNGRYVARPENLRKKDKWAVEYAIEEIKDERAQSLYQMLKKRRKDLLTSGSAMAGRDNAEASEDGEDGKKSKAMIRKEAFNRTFMEKLYALSARGRQFRRAEDMAMAQRRVYTYGRPGSVPWKSVFSKRRP